MLIATGFAALTPYRRYWVPLALPAVIAFLVLYGPLFVPRLPPNAENTPPSFTIMTYNARLLAPPHFINFPLRLAALRGPGADIIGLQEIERLSDLSDLNYPYQHIEGWLAILSRYPFNPDDITTFGTGFSNGQPSMMRVPVDIDGTRVVVYVAHFVRPIVTIRPLHYDGRARAGNVSALIERLENETDPVLLLCDCNFSSTTTDYRRLQPYLRDAWRVGGFGFGLTAPADRNDTIIPLMRSDYIFYRGLSLQHIRRGEAGGSDHYPVIADFTLSG